MDQSKQWDTCHIKFRSWFSELKTSKNENKTQKSHSHRAARGSHCSVARRWGWAHARQPAGSPGLSAAPEPHHWRALELTPAPLHDASAAPASATSPLTQKGPSEHVARAPMRSPGLRLGSGALRPHESQASAAGSQLQRHLPAGASTLTTCGPSLTSPYCPPPVSAPHLKGPH